MLPNSLSRLLTPAVFLSLWLAVTPAGAGSMLLLGAGGSGAAAPSFTGPGDIVSGATFFVSCSRAYNAAYANGTNSLCDLKDATTGTVAICTLRVKTNGFADLTGNYCTGSTTPALACAAAAGGSCVVSKVYDQTGNGNHITQATLANMPALAFSVSNGLPGLQFSGGQWMTMAAASLAIALPYSMSFVAERTTFSGNPGSVIKEAQSGNPFFTFDSSANQIDWNPAGGVDVRIAANDNVFHAAQGTTNTGSSIVYVDGANASVASTGNANAASQFLISEANFGGAFPLTGFIMELGYWPSLFSAGNAGSMNTNQHSASNGYNF